MIPKPKPPKYNQLAPPMPIVGFFHGIDPATKGDYYTDFVHVLTEKPKIGPSLRFSDSINAGVKKLSRSPS